MSDLIILLAAWSPLQLGDGDWCNDDVVCLDDGCVLHVACLIEVS